MTEPYYQADRVTLYLGDCIEVMRELPEASVDAIVTDPPYGLEFMGKAWDTFKTGRAASYSRGGSLSDVEFKNFGTLPSYVNRPAKRCRKCGRQAWSRLPCTCDPPEWEIDNSPLRTFQAWSEAWAREAYRVLKPGGHIVAFGGARTHHRLVCGIEDAGFEIRDELDWMYGSGFPKSLDVSKAIDRANGDERPVVGQWRSAGRGTRSDVQAYGLTNDSGNITSAASAASAAWEGWGTALKPAHEPVCLARKPLIGTVAQNVLAHGTGAINIDGTRIGTERMVNPSGSLGSNGIYGSMKRNDSSTEAMGRWPANVVLDEEGAALLDATVGDVRGAVSNGRRAHNGAMFDPGEAAQSPSYADRGGPSRFFYTAKASRSEREAGLDDLPPALRTDGRDPGGVGGDNPRLRVSERRNDHPTVKPVSVMRWLVRLITPPGGVVLDPFLGSGTTGMAALDEQMRFVGIDMTERYVEIARYRVTHRHVIDHEIKPASEALSQGRLL